MSHRIEDAFREMSTKQSKPCKDFDRIASLVCDAPKDEFMAQLKYRRWAAGVIRKAWGVARIYDPAIDYMVEREFNVYGLTRVINHQTEGERL